MNTPTAILDDMDRFVVRAGEATRKAAQAFDRLLRLSEERDSGQIPRVARFIAATYNSEAFKFDPFELRTVDIAISHRMLAVVTTESVTAQARFDGVKPA